MEDSEFWKELGKHIRKVRTERGLSLLDLEARTDIDKANISRIENGRTAVSTSILLKIAKGLNADLNIRLTLRDDELK